MNKVIARQGDLAFVAVPKQDLAGAKVLDTKVMATGEATGHTHRLHPAAKGFLFLLGAQMYLRALKACELLHEEHTQQIILPPGDYLIKRQSEYAPEGLRAVQD